MSIQRAILAVLAVGGWMTGLDVVRSNDRVIKRSAVYVHLLQLEEAHLVLSRPLGDGRFEYQITSAGRAARLRDDL